MSSKKTEKLLLAGLEAERESRLTESEELFARAVWREGSVQNLSALARVQLKLHRYGNAQKNLEAILHLDPSHAWCYRLISKIKHINGDVSGALAILEYAREVHPLDSDVVLAYASLIADSSAAKAIDALKSVLPHVMSQPRSASPILRRITEIQSALLRREKGLAPLDAQSWSDLCEWGDAAGIVNLTTSLLQESADSAIRLEAAADLGGVAVAAMNWDDAELWYKRARQPISGNIFDVISFDPALYAEMSDATEQDIVAGLPPVVSVRNSDQGGTFSLYLASDPEYFERFTIPFLRSLNSYSPGAAAHVHLLDGNEQEWLRLEHMVREFSHIHIGITAEASGAKAQYAENARDYYHAIRLIRFYQHLQTCQVPLWMLDVDVSLRVDPTSFLRQLASCDVAVHGFPNALDVWQKCSAALIGVAPTLSGRAYMKLVAAYISHWKRGVGLRWGIDQVALFCAFAHLHRCHRLGNIWFVQSDIFGRDGASNSVFDFSVGVKKFKNAA